MVNNNPLKMHEMEFEPSPPGRILSTQIREKYHRRSNPVRKLKRKRKRLSRETLPMMTSSGLRVRSVIQEMRAIYNQVIGVGDQLLDLRLSSFIPKDKGASKMGKADLQALNYDLAKLVSTIFGPSVAEMAYERINGIIYQTFN